MLQICHNAAIAGWPVQVCGAQLAEASAWRQVGSDFLNACELDAAALLQLAAQSPSGPVFYDLYYVDGTQGDSATTADGEVSVLALELPGAPVLYPTPLRLDVGNDDAPGILARRFFVVDSALGQAARGNEQSFIQYPQEATLTIRVRPYSRVLLAVLAQLCCKALVQCDLRAKLMYPHAQCAIA